MNISLSVPERNSMKKPSKRSIFISRLLRDRYLILLLLPGIAYYIIFQYIPMIGVAIAFQDYNPFQGFFHSDWVGLKHFITFFRGIYFMKIISNTLILNMYLLIGTFPLPIIFALLLNEVRNYRLKRITQTVSYLPYFISSVVVVGMVLDFLSPSTGIVAKIMGMLDMDPIYFMAKPEYFRPIFTITNIWQTTGWSSIIYFAALTGIDQEQYEASYIDGANRFQSMIYITLPGIMSCAVIIFILNLGSILNVGFEMVYLMQNPLNLETSEVISTFVYKRGILGTLGYPDPSFATAVNLFQSAIGFLMIVGANAITKKISDIGIW